MRRQLATLAIIGCLCSAGITQIAQAQIGEPMGVFQITIKQGATTIAQDMVTIGAGGNLVDLKASFQDGDPEDFVQIGTLGTQGNETPIILKVTSDGGPNESYRVLHWYIDAPISMTDIYSPGPNSLFDPLGGSIEVTITGLSFDNGALTEPLLIDNDTYLTSFMRDYQGHYYESSMANLYDEYGHTLYDIQVPGAAYLDGNAGLYDFQVLGTGAASSWTWTAIENPGLGTSVNDGLGNTISPLDPGYVFELGLSVGFFAVPEPATIAFLVPGLLMMGMRRRKR